VSGRPDRQPWSWVPVVVTLLTVASITGIASAVSYEHEYQLARRHGQDAWVSALLPFTVDGLILGAAVVLVWAAMAGIRRPLRPLAVLLVGIAATIAANLASGIGDGALGAAVSAWSGVALILISDVAMWLMGALRRLSNPLDIQPAAACSCPPAPVSLAEALPLARAALRDRGEPAGEQALADRFGVPRNQVRKLLAGPVPDTPPQYADRVLTNGDGSHA